MDIRKLNPGNCDFMKEGLLGFAIVCKMSNNNPCEGCFYINNGVCPGYRLMVHNEHAKKVGKIPKFTNKEIAEKLMVSKRQVAKMRKENTLPEEYM